jgi:hypothetical protein
MEIGYSGLVDDAKAGGIKTPFTQPTYKFSIPMMLVVGGIAFVAYFLYRRTANAGR